MTRRRFLAFFLAAPALDLVKKKSGLPKEEIRQAMFWRGSDEA